MKGSLSRRYYTFFVEVNRGSRCKMRIPCLFYYLSLIWILIMKGLADSVCIIERIRRFCMLNYNKLRWVTFSWYFLRSAHLIGMHVESNTGISCRTDHGTMYNIASAVQSQ